MALTPPNNNKGEYNTSITAPVPWDEIAATNHRTISRNSMPFSSTVEYKGYFKAEATGPHVFNLSGSDSVVGYSWVSCAPRDSDHIIENQTRARLVSQRSFGIIIPLSRGNNWRWEDPEVLGTDFIGYGYWPKEGYGNKDGFNNIYRNKLPGQDCSFYPTVHEYLLPGDLRPHGQQYAERFQGSNAGPAWQGPEDPNFSTKCFGEEGGEWNTPLVRLESTFSPDIDIEADANTPGRLTQVFLDNSFKAEGLTNENWAQFKTVGTSDNDLHNYIWPKTVNVKTTPPGGKRQPERVQIRFSLKFFQEEQDYTFEWKSRDGLKIWYSINNNNAKSLLKFPDNEIGPTSIEVGNNPCNFTATGSDSDSSSGWLPGRKKDGFTGKLRIPPLSTVLIHGYATGVPDDNTHGFSLRVTDSDDVEVFSSSDLLQENFLSGLIGIDECGYNALLDSQSRVPFRRRSEFFKADGWKGITPEDQFFADYEQGDTNQRDTSTTRQYLWSNALTKTRDGTSIPGSVYLRQGDYYFIRTIVSNHENKEANYRFTVKSPVSGSLSDVIFTGNGDPSSDTVVGGDSGGNGVPLSKDKLCNSILYSNGEAISDNTNFAIVEDMQIVLNLTDLGVSSEDIGKEGQAEKITIGDETTTGSASTMIGLPNGVTLSLRKLVSGLLDKDQKAAVLSKYFDQLKDNITMPIEDFRSAITSQAVQQWGSGGNYSYIYHAVSTIITSICAGTTIGQPGGTSGGRGSGILRTTLQKSGSGTLRTTLQKSGSGSGSGSGKDDSGDGECLDLNVNQIGSSGVITTKCGDECLPFTEYPDLAEQYTKSRSNYSGMDSRYYDRIIVKQEWSPGSFTGKKGYERIEVQGQKLYYNLGEVKNFGFEIEAQKVISVPFTIPDYTEPDWALDQYVRYNSFRFQMRAGSKTLGSGDMPNLLVWYSDLAGGSALGRPVMITNVEEFLDPNISASADPRAGSIYGTLSTSIYNQNLDDVPGYLGNKHGVKWLNIMPANPNWTGSGNWVENLDIGSADFVNNMSTTGVSVGYALFYMIIPEPDCSKL